MKIRYRCRALAGAVPRMKFRRQVDRFLATAKDCESAQKKTLQRILALNAGSRYSNMRGLSSGLSINEFRRRMPISSYEEFREPIESLQAGDFDALLGPDNKLLMFSLTSGTTGRSKFIPITSEFLADYRRGWQMWGIRTFDRFPDLRYRNILQMNGNPNLFQTSGNIPCGNISGLVATMQHKVVRSLYSIPATVGTIENCAARYYTAVRIAVADDNIGLFTTANPATLINIARCANENATTVIRDIADGTLREDCELTPEIRQQLAPFIRRPNPARAKQLEKLLDENQRLYPRDVWPHLQTLAVWTCGSAGAWLPGTHEFYGKLPTRDHGLHASEGRITNPLHDDSAGLLDITSHFFEFIPESEYGKKDAAVLLPHELEVGECYFVLMSTVSGLYRYDICDVVKCVGFHGTTPSLVFQHKGASISSIAGEKLTESQVVSAFSNASRDLGVSVSHYTVAPVWDDPPRYQLFLDRDDDISYDVSAQLAEGLDANLRALNCEYAEKRESHRLNKMESVLLPPRTWQRYALDRIERSGGSLEQYKHPCLVNDLEFRANLEQNLGITLSPIIPGSDREAGYFEQASPTSPRSL